MKKRILIGGLILICFLTGVYYFLGDDYDVIEGTILIADETDVLMSQRSNLKVEDLYKSDIEWFDGDYELLLVSQMPDVAVGDVVQVTVKKKKSMGYPHVAIATDYEVIGHVVEEVGEDTLDDIFPQTIGTVQTFNGYSEYGHVQTLNKMIQSEEATVYVFNGQMSDGYYGYQDNRIFEVAYEVKDDCIVELVKNEDPYRVLNDDSLLNSIIPSKIVLKLPLSVGNQWIEDFTYQGTSYTATTTLVNVDSDSLGKTIYETVTTVPNVREDGGSYKEVRVFTTGSGMTSFSNCITYSAEEELSTDDDLYLVGYTLSSETVQK